MNLHLNPRGSAASNGIETASFARRAAPRANSAVHSTKAVR